MRRDDPLRQQIAERLSGWDWRGPQPAAGATPPKLAAVALVIVDAGHGAGREGVESSTEADAAAGIGRPEGAVDTRGLPRFAHWSADAALLLTRRAASLRGHAGQWALPGGRQDEGETPEAAALRELAEELGLLLTPADVLGRLDCFVTRSGYAITPVIAWGGEARALRPNPAEVAGVHRIPLTEFLRADAPILEPLAGSPHPVLKMPVGDSWIAAPTAALLYQFREVCLLGRETRVAHFEQPTFAWR